MSEFARLRHDMVAHQIVTRGVRSPLVLDAIRCVPRELFVPENLRDLAYDDGPLPIAADQTISQPYIVALMIEALLLQGGETVLEIGTGSGYAAAVLSRIAGVVFTVERIASLAGAASALLGELAYDNVHVELGDGSLGWNAHAPYTAIVVTAGSPIVPPSLKAQLAIGGRLVIPVGRDSQYQQLLRLTRMSERDYRCEKLEMVCFVPLLGQEGWAP